MADPPSDVIERAVALCRDERIDLVLSIGGGSALDTAKLVAYLAQSGDRLDDIYGVGLAKGAAPAARCSCRRRPAPAPRSRRSPS